MSREPWNRRWLTVNEAAEECGVTRRTVWNWVAAGKLATRRTAGGGLRIAGDTLWGGRQAPHPRRDAARKVAS